MLHEKRKEEVSVSMKLSCPSKCDFNWRAFANEMIANISEAFLTRWLMLRGWLAFLCKISCFASVYQLSCLNIRMFICYQAMGIGPRAKSFDGREIN